MKKCKRYICESDNCNDYLLQNTTSCAKICDARIKSPISDFGKNIILNNSCNYPIPVFTFKENIFKSESLFSDGCNSNNQRQFKWRFTNQNSQLIYETPFEFGDTTFLTGTYDEFYAGEYNIDLLVFLRDNSQIILNENDVIYIQLFVIDCNGNESNVLSNSVNIIYIITAELWAGKVLSDYLIINEHVDSFGNNIPNRELTASQKQYIYDRAVDTLWQRFGIIGGSIIERSPLEMAQSMFYFQRAAGDKGDNGGYNKLTAGKTVLTVTNTIINENDIELFPRFNSPNDYGCLIVTKELVANYWSEVENYSTLFRNYSTGITRANGFSNAIFPILKHPNPIDDFRIFNSGEFVGIMPNLYPNVDLNATGQAVQLIASPNFSTSFSNLDGINLTFIARCTWGIRIRGNGLSEQALKDIIDVFHSLRNTTLNAGGLLDLRQNTGSTAIANDPVYAAKLSNISTDAGWVISI